MSDTNERSVASNGSHGEPVAWGVFYGDGKLHSSLDSHAKAECTALTMRKFDHLGVYVSPLYRQPQPTLTDQERPVAWHVTADGFEYATLLEEHARAIVEEEGGTVAPLYQTVTPLYRRPTLTDEEQLAIAWAAGEADEWDEEDTPEVAAHAEALRGLAKRLF